MRNKIYPLYDIFWKNVTGSVTFSQECALMGGTGGAVREIESHRWRSRVQPERGLTRHRQRLRPSPGRYRWGTPRWGLQEWRHSRLGARNWGEDGRTHTEVLLLHWRKTPEESGRRWQEPDLGGKCPGHGYPPPGRAPIDPVRYRQVAEPCWWEECSWRGSRSDKGSVSPS